jgi:rubrerythrin
MKSRTRAGGRSADGAFEKLIQFVVSKEEEAASFYEFRASVTEKKHIRKLHPHPIEDLKISDYLVEQPFDPKMDHQNILILAMKREEKSYHFYRDLARKMEVDGMADPLMRPAEKEAGHRSKLEEL